MTRSNRQVEEDDHLMTFDEFLKAVVSFGFIDYDGYGHWSDGKTVYSNTYIKPSDVADYTYDGYRNEIAVPKDDFIPLHSHIVWCNR